MKVLDQRREIQAVLMLAGRVNGHDSACVVLCSGPRSAGQLVAMREAACGWWDVKGSWWEALGLA